MKSPDVLAVYRPLVLSSLEAFIESHRQAGGPAWKIDVMERLRGFVTSGKLMRGCLVCYGYALGGSAKSGSELPDAVLNTAVAIELMHGGLLIHDDIIDQDELRRGQPAIHSQYGQLAARQGLAQASRMGENLALCAGDMALLMAFESLADARNDQSRELTGLFARELTAVCAGQMQDTYLGATTKPPSKKAIYEIMRAKTATYSVALPLVAGAILAEQTAAIRRRLYAIGLAAGTMFQIRDDELGVFGQTASLGKPVGSDILEGKKTLLYYYLWRASSKIERHRLTVIFGNPRATPADIIYVRKAMRRHKVPTRLREDIAKLEQTAFGHIDKLRIGQRTRAELRQMVRFCAARKF